MTAEQAHRFALTGHDLEGRNRTIILWREADRVEGRVVRRVVVTLDATMATALHNRIDTVAQLVGEHRATIGSAP